jgi:hypothetical protein
MKRKRQPWLIQEDFLWERYIRMLQVLVLQAKGYIDEQQAQKLIWAEYHQ